MKGRRLMIKVLVNGKTYEVEKDKKLMRFLRDDLHLTSVKDGCSQGACGTCTVLVDGRRPAPVFPCSPRWRERRSLLQKD